MRVLSEGPWMIGEHYLHAHNFIADEAKIMTLPVWIRFPWLLMEYYTEEWLMKAGNMIGRTLRIDNTTQATARGRFARVCIEIDLEKPVTASCRMRGKKWQIQYEGLHDLCFTCGKYGHKEIKCPLTNVNNQDQAGDKTDENTSTKEIAPVQKEDQRSTFGSWLVVQRSRRRSAKMSKGSTVIPTTTDAKIAERDHGEPNLAGDGRQEKQTPVGRGPVRQQSNGGSRFLVLNGDQTDMETDPGADSVEDEMEAEQQPHQQHAEAAKAYGKEKKAAQGGNSNQVNLNVSNMGLAEELRPLGGINTTVLSQGQGQ